MLIEFAYIKDKTEERMVKNEESIEVLFPCQLY